MKRGTKYDIKNLVESHFEPGSGQRVLKNLLKIRHKQVMDESEAREQLRTLDKMASLYNEDHVFVADDIRHIHRIWLRGIYPWAGEYRQVNISKGGFSFAAAAHIPALMKEFERNVLSQRTPCRANASEEIIESLAVVHVELVLIHPFREGNGRMARLLSIAMGWQAKLPTLDFGGIVGKKKNEYFAAVQAGMKHNYIPMKLVFESVVARTLKNIKSSS